MYTNKLEEDYIQDFYNYFTHLFEMNNILNIVINTCVGYVDVACKPLLDSLHEANVPSSAIHVVVGEAADEDDYIKDNVHYHNRKWFNIDNNGTLWLSLDKTTPSFITSKWIIYLHDTSYVHKDFWQNACDLCLTFEDNLTCAKLHHPYSMGMGFYSLSWLRQQDVVDYMSSLQNFDIKNKQHIKQNLVVLEDTLFKYAERKHLCMRTLNPTNTIVSRDLKMYGSGVPRIVEYYSSPGVYKVKANWGQSCVLMTKL